MDSEMAKFFEGYPVHFAGQLIGALLHCTVLYCTEIYCTVLYCTALHCTEIYCTVLSV